jgi:transcription-repair coupling factor (superfamily II helicase)
MPTSTLREASAFRLSDLKQAYRDDARSRALLSALNSDWRGGELAGEGGIGFGVGGHQSPACIHVQQLCGSLPAIVLTTLHAELNATLLCVARDREEAAYLHHDLEQLQDEQGPTKPLYFPASYRGRRALERQDASQNRQRAEVLSIAGHPNSGALLIVTYPEALAEQVVSRSTLTQNTLDLRLGAPLDVDFLIDVLIEYGFERVDFVFEAGQFALRGGLIDVFSYAHELPCRIELDGDSIAGMRSFEPDTQRSVRRMELLSLMPNPAQSLPDEQRQNILEFLPDDTVLWVHEPGTVTERIDLMHQELLQLHTADLPTDEVDEHTDAHPPDPSRLVLPQQWEALCLKHRMLCLSTPTGGGARTVTTSIAWGASPQPAIRKNFKLLIEQMGGHHAEGFRNLLFSDAPRQIDRLYQIFEDLKAGLLFTPLPGSLHEGFIDHGLRFSVYTDHQLFERYHKYNLQNRYRKSESLLVKELRDMKPGDFVVHIDHGVGVFDGLQKLDVNGQQQEAVRLLYRDGDLLYVGINSLHKIARYTGKEGAPPKVNKLGSEQWEKLKSRTKAQVKDIARDLIALYARRRSIPGFAFSPDGYLQNELEVSFMYEDTPDQFKASEATKADMQRPYPMDRLVCGDVGFGKTEIAIRAAFKAACDGKQVAVLVPTTILALQHFKTFSRRLAEFPVTVDYLNRFRTAREEKEVLQKVKDGKVDILIGTHKLVSKNLVFKDLGLLVIDEEQKFGVGVKEKLRQLRVHVDTLTLTATPIPRTLQFSLMGARDLSVIHTPPVNRQPVQTERMVFDEERIREAILFEVGRGGQVFFVHNRVQNISEMAGMLSRLCPGLRVGIGHGQMEGEALEKVLLAFIEGQYDVLVATNIIESGLDIPNANTIFINGAHHFGLSDLHQMRGRVGRSNTKAFCYLIAPSSGLLTSEAAKRLKAMEDFSDLGSGFQISLRDLDIRGAGNLLGAEQSGFISEIGFDMYQKILDDALRELKEDEWGAAQDSADAGAAQVSGDADTAQVSGDAGAAQVSGDAGAAHGLGGASGETSKATGSEGGASGFSGNRDWSREVQLDTDLHALLPDNYVRSTSERLSLYMQLDNLETEDDLQQFRLDLEDRFGPLPASGETLFDLMRLRRAGRRLGMEKIVLKKGLLKCYLLDGKHERYYQSVEFGKLLKAVQGSDGKITMKQHKNAVFLEVDAIRTAHHALELLEQWAN